MKSNYSVGGVDLYDRYPTTDTPNVIQLLPTSFTDKLDGRVQRYNHMAADSDWLVVAWSTKVVIYRDYGNTQAATITRINPVGQIATPVEVTIFRRIRINPNHIYTHCFAIRWSHGEITIHRLANGSDVRVITNNTANLSTAWQPVKMTCNTESLFVVYRNNSAYKVVLFRNPFNAPVNQNFGSLPFAVDNLDLNRPFYECIIANRFNFVVLHNAGNSIFRVRLNNQTRLFSEVQGDYQLPEQTHHMAFSAKEEGPPRIQFICVNSNKNVFFGHLPLTSSDEIEIYRNTIEENMGSSGIAGVIYDPDDFYGNKDPSETQVIGGHRIGIDDRLPFVFVGNRTCLYGSFVPGPETGSLDFRSRNRGEFHCDRFDLPNNPAWVPTRTPLATSGRTVYWAGSGFIHRTQFDIPINHHGYSVDGLAINKLSGFDMAGNVAPEVSNYQTEGTDLTMGIIFGGADKFRPTVRTVRALGDHVRETISHMFESRPGGVRVHKNLIFVHGNDGKLHRSINYGKMFVARNPHFSENSVQGICVEDNVVIAGGSSARISFSTDYGENFTVGQRLPSQFNHITCMDIKGGVWFAASHNGRIYRGIGPSLNLGREVPAANGGRRFIDIKIIGNKPEEPHPLCIAVGEEARIKFSRDYGFTWDTIRNDVPTDVTLNTIVALGDVIMVLGGDGWAVRTDDRGETWTTFQIPGARTNVSSFEMHGIFYAVGARFGSSGIRRSFDLGLTWENLPISGNGFFRGIHGSGDRIATVSDDNYLGVFEVRASD